MFTLKIACRVRRWRSVKTKRGFFGEGMVSEAMSSLRLQPAKIQPTLEVFSIIDSLKEETF